MGAEYCPATQAVHDVLPVLPATALVPVGHAVHPAVVD